MEAKEIFLRDARKRWESGQINVPVNNEALWDVDVSERL